jgi:uncharacterized protein (TIGR02466 family)
MDKHLPFTSPIWANVIEHDYSDLEKKILKLSKTLPSSHISNQGGYQSPNFTVSDLQQKLPEILTIVNASIEYVAKDIKTNLMLLDSWFNINSKGDYNSPHVHPERAFSGVLYLKTPSNCGSLVLRNPTPATHYPIKDDIDNFWGVWKVAPTKGLFCMFPSYIEHYVEPNQSNQKRISVAFNFVQV